MTDPKLQPPLVDRPLTNKEKLFVEAYMHTWSGSKAARVAGFKSRADIAGSRILARPQVRARIAERIKEEAMEAGEALKRLAEQARLNPADFYTFETRPVLNVKGDPVLDDDGNLVTKTEAVINWDAVRERGYLVKGLEYDRRGNLVIRFHDAQNALIHIGKHLKLFSDQVDLNLVNAVKAYIGISPDDWDAEQMPALAPAVEDE